MKSDRHKWRLEQIEKLYEMPVGKSRARLARRLHKADKISLDRKKKPDPWKEIEPYLVEDEDQERAEREKLIKPRDTVEFRHELKEMKSELPDFQTFQRNNPFDPNENYYKDPHAVPTDGFNGSFMPFLNQTLKGKYQEDNLENLGKESPDEKD